MTKLSTNERTVVEAVLTRWLIRGFSAIVIANAVLIAGGWTFVTSVVSRMEGEFEDRLAALKSSQDLRVQTEVDRIVQRIHLDLDTKLLKDTHQQALLTVGAVQENIARLQRAQLDFAKRMEEVEGAANSALARASEAQSKTAEAGRRADAALATASETLTKLSEDDAKATLESLRRLVADKSALGSYIRSVQHLETDLKDIKTRADVWSRTLSEERLKAITQLADAIGVYQITHPTDTSTEVLGIWVKALIVETDADVWNEMRIGSKLVLSRPAELIPGNDVTRRMLHHLKDGRAFPWAHKPSWTYRPPAHISMP